MSVIQEDVIINIKVDHEEMDTFITSNKKLNARTLETTKGFFNQTKVMEKQKRIGDKWVTVQQKSVKVARAFKMEYLGLMFAGMGIAKLFGSMTQGAMDWLGISELFTTSLNIITLEGLLPMTDSIYSAITGLMDLPQATKKSIAETMLFMNGFGTTLEVMSSLVLMLSSVAMAFPAAVGPATTAIGILISKMSPLFSTIPGFSELGDIMNLVGSGIAVGGVAKTVADITGALKIDSSSVDNNLPGNLNSEFSRVFGKTFQAAVGGGLTFFGLLSMESAKATPSVLDDLSSSLTTVFGAAFLGQAVGLKGGKAGAFGLGATLLLRGALVDEGFFGDIERYLGYAGILAATGKASLWFLPVLIVLDFFIEKTAKSLLSTIDIDKINAAAKERMDMNIPLNATSTLPASQLSFGAFGGQTSTLTTQSNPFGGGSVSSAPITTNTFNFSYNISSPSNEEIAKIARDVTVEDLRSLGLIN